MFLFNMICILYIYMFFSRVNCLNLAGTSSIETSFVKSTEHTHVIAVGADLEWEGGVVGGLVGILPSPLN